MHKLLIAFGATSLFATGAAAQSVAGHVYITLGSGDAQFVRGAEMHLVCASPDAKVTSDSAMAEVAAIGERTRATFMRLVETRPSAHEGIARVAGATAYARVFLPRLADGLEALLMSAKVASTRTTHEGAYSFTHVPPGNYYLVVRHKTRNNDVLWRVPVALTDSSSQTLDLSNHNSLDLSAVLGFRIVEMSERAVEQMITEHFPRQRSIFEEGNADVAREAARAALPNILASKLTCAAR